MFEAIKYVTGALTLAAFVAAVVATVLRIAIKRKESLIRSAPEAVRGHLVETALEGFRVDTADLTKQQKYDLLATRMRNQEARLGKLLRFGVTIAVIAAVLTVTLMAMPTLRGVRGGALASAEQMQAREGWARGTTIILKTWRDQARRYSELLASRLGTDAAGLGSLDAASAERARELHASVFAQLEEEGHQEYLKENADPRIVNPALRQHFPDIIVTMPDGTTQTIVKATEGGRAMHEQLFVLVREAVLAGRDPLEDSAVIDHMNAYVGRRQAITEAIDMYVAGAR